MKVLIHSKDIIRCIDWFENKQCGSRLCWGVIELKDYYKTKIQDVKGIFATTKSFLTNNFNVLYIVDFIPKHYLPFPILKLFSNKKIIVLMHSHPYGKGNSILQASWLKRKIINFYCKGIDKALFFSPLSMKETIETGAIHKNKCKLIHWGEDLDFINNTIANDINIGNYWISTGKERRDIKILEGLNRSKQIKSNQFLWIKSGVKFIECLEKTAKSKGIVVVPNKKGLTYCTGLTTIVEAFALGKPIICIKNNYFPFDIEKEKCGIHVKNEYDIIKAIKLIDSNNDLYNEFSKNSARMSQKFNMKIFKEELINVINEI